MPRSRAAWIRRASAPGGPKEESVGETSASLEQVSSIPKTPSETPAETPGTFAPSAEQQRFAELTEELHQAAMRAAIAEAEARERDRISTQSRELARL